MMDYKDINRIASLKKRTNSLALRVSVTENMQQLIIYGFVNKPVYSYQSPFATAIEIGKHYFYLFIFLN